MARAEVDGGEWRGWPWLGWEKGSGQEAGYDLPNWDVIGRR